MIFVCMFVVCVCPIEFLLLLLFSLLLLYFTLLLPSPPPSSHSTLFVMMMRTNNFSSTLYPLSSFLFLFFHALSCACVCVCAHGCAICHFFIGFGVFASSFSAYFSIDAILFNSLSLFAEIVYLSFFCLTLTLPSLHSIPTHL